jgi:hypothetical protein
MYLVYMYIQYVKVLIWWKFLQIIPIVTRFLEDNSRMNNIND